MSDRPELRIVGTGQAPDYDSHEEWLAAGARFSETQSASSWAFADWLEEGRARWGDEAMREAAKETGASPGKISHYLTTAMVYPPLRRRNGLTFSHHLEVARLDQSDADRLLDRAEAEGWSHRRMREAARDASLEGENERLRRENATLKRQLKEARLEGSDLVKQTLEQITAGQRSMRNESRRIASLAEALAASEAIESLHGNARRGLARGLIRLANAMANNTNAATERIAKAASAINGGA